MLQTNVARLGNWLAQHQRMIRTIQWIVIIIYIFLIVTPVFLPLPDESSSLFHHLTVFAGFLFWGIWWPFVLLSIIIFGRSWCGILCPEGSLSEFTNQFGLQKSIPKWLRWGGWPFVAFCITTIYGQMTSVYQYPKPVLCILGGSTIAAMLIGFIYGKSTRVWCKYLCPVTGVFGVLAKLAPWYYKPMQSSWTKQEIQQINSVHCPTLLPLTKMSTSANCLMCGKCSLTKDKIQLTARSSNKEIVITGGLKNHFSESILIIFGLCGIALAAFQWTNSFWFQHMREVVDSWFLLHQIFFVFNTNTPWWIFTHYPERGDTFSWLYGCEMITYILVVGFAIGILLTSLMAISTSITGKWNLSRFNHLSLALIPIGGCSVFIGLLGNTSIILQKYANIGFTWINDMKFILLVLATTWSLILTYQIVKKYTLSWSRKIGCLLMMFLSCGIVNYSWFLVLHVWAAKADSVPWYSLI